MRNDESATALAAEGLVAVCLARTSSVERVAVATATPALRTTKRSRGQQQRRAKEAKLPAEKRAALPAVPSLVQPVRAASPETAAAKFREEQKRLKRVRVLFSREELDYGAGGHVRRVDELVMSGAAPTRAQLAQRRRMQAEAGATGVLALPPDVFTPARCDDRPPHDRTVGWAVHPASLASGFPRKPSLSSARRARRSETPSTARTSKPPGRGCSSRLCWARAFAH